MTDETPDVPDDALLRRYLLGEAAAEELEHVERHLFADPEGLERIEAVEAELLDAAARGELPAAEGEKVLARLASTPAGRARLAFARDLTHLSDGLSDTLPGLLPPLARPVPPARPQWAPAWALRAAVAAGLAAAVVAGWLVLKPAGRPGATVASRPAPTAARVRPDGGPAPIPPTPAATPVHPALATAVFELSLATERGAAATPRLRLTPGTARVELRVQLEEGETYRAYRAAVRDATGRTVASARGPERRRTDGGLEIVLAVAAADLPPGRYEIAVQGERGAAAPEDLGFQEFAVVR